MAKMAKNSQKWQKTLITRSNLPKTTETIEKKNEHGKNGQKWHKMTINGQIGHIEEAGESH